MNTQGMIHDSILITIAANDCTIRIPNSSNYIDNSFKWWNFNVENTYQLCSNANESSHHALNGFYQGRLAKVDDIKSCPHEKALGGTYICVSHCYWQVNVGGISSPTVETWPASISRTLLGGNLSLSFFSLCLTCFIHSQTKSSHQLRVSVIKQRKFKTWFLFHFTHPTGCR